MVSTMFKGRVSEQNTVKVKGLSDHLGSEGPCNKSNLARPPEKDKINVKAIYLHMNSL